MCRIVAVSRSFKAQALQHPATSESDGDPFLPQPSSLLFYILLFSTPMRAPYPSLTLVLTTSRSDGSNSTDTHLQYDVFTRFQSGDDSLLKTIHYTYKEDNCSFQYPFQVVEQPPASDREACSDGKRASKITKFLDSMLDTLNRQWKRSQRGLSSM